MSFIPRFDFYADLLIKLRAPAKVVPVFDNVQMQGEKGAVATVDLPSGDYISFSQADKQILVQL